MSRKTQIARGAENAVHRDGTSSAHIVYLIKSFRAYVLKLLAYFFYNIITIAGSY